MKRRTRPLVRRAGHSAEAGDPPRGSRPGNEIRRQPRPLPPGGLTHACVIERAGEHKHDVVGPALAVQLHLIFFDHQEMQVADALHGVKKV